MNFLQKKHRLILLLSILFLSAAGSYAQTTGKIAGVVTDFQSGDPLIGANVLVVGTTLGAAVGGDGSFYIINVPPGRYSVRVSMVGYASELVKDVQVSVNRTVNLEVKLKSSAIQTQEVVVVEKRSAVKKDQTSSTRNVSAQDMEVLPVENVGQVVSMQAGVVQGHFRGGRLDEVSYMIDGMPVNASFNNTSRAVDVEVDVVKDLEVITGTFNAEYGQAMSGVVNAVTKDGGNEFHGSISANTANYLTSNTSVFVGNKASDVTRNKDFKGFLSGPVIKNALYFLANVRYHDNGGYLNGVRRFNVNDYSDFSSQDPTTWYTEHNGNGETVSMNWSKNLSFFGKLTTKPLQSLKTSLLFNYNKNDWQDYRHQFKYNPDGMTTQHKNSYMVALQLNHLLSNSAFYEFKASYLNDKFGNYVYENPNDPGYVHDLYMRSEGTDFYTGGQDKSYVKRTTRDINLKFDLTWQVNKNHSIKTGGIATLHNLDNQESQIRNKYYGTQYESQYSFDSLAHKRTYLYYEPVVMPDSSVFSDIYNVKPREYAVYVQDKMEYRDMVINAGLRYDVFDPNTVYPSQLRNPANQLSFPDNPEKMSSYPEAKIQSKLSPRLGLAYQMGEYAVLHFSYGHFFQMPPLYALYQNHSFLVAPNDFATTMGSPEIRPQKTVQYEVGLWQQIMTGMNLEVSVFYRDIYDLLSAKVITTYNQIQYGLYSNKDYGNSRGIEVKFEFLSRPFTAYLNYTLQYTRGNADNPTFTFTRAGDNMDPVNRLIPMSWDQRHTLNASVGYNTENYGATLTAYYNSGTPYTWTPIPESPLSRVNLFPNNSPKPSQVTVDLQAFYDILEINSIQVRLNLLVYNLLDQLNDVSVYGTTGKAYTDVIRQSDLYGYHSDFSTYRDVVHNPSMYAAPRLVKFGVEFRF